MNLSKTGFSNRACFCLLPYRFLHRPLTCAQRPVPLPWVDSGAKAGSAWATTTNYIEVFPDTQYQTILGFGGTFQEKWWDAMNHLSAAGKDSVIRAFFDTSGCNCNWGRIPIGSAISTMKLPHTRSTTAAATIR